MAESLAFPHLRKEAQGGKEGQRMQKEAKRTQEGQRRQEDATTPALTEEVHQSNAGDYKGGSWHPLDIYIYNIYIYIYILSAPRATREEAFA